MMKALFFDKFGDVDVLRYGDLAPPSLDNQSVLVAPTFVGLNFADIYRRQGRYVLQGEAPWVGGYEGVGYVVATGADVSDWKTGQRVGFVDVPRAHAGLVSAQPDQLVTLPENIPDKSVAAVLLQGLTAQYLVEDSVAVRSGDRVLIQAAAGGVGRLVTQMASAKGAQVYALASTAAKREQARLNGAVAAYGYQEDWVALIRQETGKGVDVAYDSVGSTLMQSLATLRDGGRAVIFGKAGGTPPLVDPLQLMEGSKGIIGGDLWTYLKSREERQVRVDRLFAALHEGRITLPHITVFPLSAGQDAHRLLEDRNFAGKIIFSTHEEDRFHS